MRKLQRTVLAYMLAGGLIIAVYCWVGLIRVVILGIPTPNDILYRDTIATILIYLLAQHTKRWLDE